MADKNMDFTRLSEVEKINGIKITNVPQYIREKAYLTDFSETLAQLAEMIIQLGVNLSLDPDEALEWARKLQQSVSQSEFDSWVATLLDGGPSIFMNTLSELQTTYPNGAAGVALVRETDPAKIYVWNGGSWEDFGDYQGIEVKDKSIKSEKIYGLEGLNFNLYNSSDHAIKDFYINSVGELAEGLNVSAYAKVPVNQLTKYTLWRPDGNYNIGNGALVFKDTQGNIISFVGMSTLQNGVYNGVPYITFETPANTANVLFNLKLSTFDSTKTTILVEGSVLNDEVLNNKQILKLFDANLVDMGTRNLLNDFVSSVKGTGGNLYNKDRDYKEGVYSSTNGTISQASGWGLADVPVNNVSKVSIWKPDGDFSGQIGAIGFYKDDEKLGYSYLPTKNGIYEGVGFVTLTLPEGTNRLAITVKVKEPLIDNSDSLMVVEGEAINSDTLEAKLASVNGYNVPKIEASQSSRPYLDVKWAALGDSLTEKNIRATTVYHEYVAEELGFKVNNMGKSGTGYKNTDANSTAFYQRVLDVPLDTQVVTFFGSLNDLGSGAELGTPSDTGTDTIAGAINTTIDNLYGILPTVPLGIISPTPWHTSDLNNENNSATKYARLLAEICRKRGIPFLDLYFSSGLRPWDAGYRTLMYSKDPVGNGTHPDESGHKLIAPQFREFIKTLI